MTRKKTLQKPCGVSGGQTQHILVALRDKPWIEWIVNDRDAGISWGKLGKKYGVRASRVQAIYSRWSERVHDLHEGKSGTPERPGVVWNIDQPRGNFKEDMERANEEREEQNKPRPKLRLVKWMQENLFIVDKGKDVVPFILKPAQRRLAALVVMLEYLETAFEIVILKSRQLGFSTEIEGFAFAWADNIPRTECFLAANAVDNTKKIFRITENYYNHYEAARAKGAQFHRKCLKYDFPHNSRIDIATAGTSDAGASGTTNVIHLSEYGLFPNAEDFWQALRPAFPKKPHSRLFVESTGRPDAVDFKDLWDSAFKHDPEHPIKTYLYVADCIARQVVPRIGVFESWTRDEEAAIPLLPGEKFDLTDQERELQTEFGLSLPQLKYWRERWKGEMKGNWARALVEYPLKPEHPFLYFGGPIYDQVILAKMRENAKPPLFRGDIGFDENAVFGKPILSDNEFGNLLIFEHPVPGALYSIGVDTAQGTGVGDFNEIVVVKLGEKRKVVAHFRTNERFFGPGMAAVIAWLLGTYYNQALIVSERQAVNVACIEKLVEGHPHYPKMSAPYPFLYSYVQRDELTQEEREEIGFQTTQGAKQSSIDELQEFIHADLYDIHSLILIDQLAGFCENPLKTGRNKWEMKFKDPVTQKYHDDAESALRMANHGATWLLENDIPALRMVG